MAILPGRRLGPYAILAAIGAGGMGEVYKARDTRLERTVATKILPGHLDDRANLRERFDREAKTIASLNHSLHCGMLLVLILSILNYGCGGAGSSQLPPAIRVSVSAASPNVLPGGTDQITAVVINDSANMGVSWSVTCPIAPCGSVSPPTTASEVATTYTAPPSPPVDGETVTLVATSVADLTQKAGTTVTVPALLKISTVSLPDGTVGVPYSQAIQVTGGEAPFTFRTAGIGGGNGLVPPGLSMGTNAGILSGTPITAGANFHFFIDVRDANGQVATQGYIVSIIAAVVQTSSGPIQGNLVACGLPECAASNVLEFLGIPYAAPPVGSLRWKPPQPTTPAQTQQPGARCMSVNGSGVVKGQEDCLYLNVFITPQTIGGLPQPVMVYIHGGANRIGTSNPGLDFSDPPELATQGVILVTVEYRLGILGFFTNPSLDLENAGSSGNYGLRDQIAALAWVHQNIAAFGGDPTHVTVFGMSSGSSNIEALLSSPLTQGPSSQCGAGQQCFSAAIMEGGSVVHNQYLLLADKEAQDAPLVAGLNGCVVTDISCLRGVPAATLVAPCVPPATTGCNPNVAYSTWYSQTDPVLIVNLEPDVVPVNTYDWLQDPLHGGSPVPILLGSNREDAAMAGIPSWCAGVALPAPRCPNDDPTSSVIDENGFDSAIHAEFDSLVTASGSNSIVSLYPADNVLSAPVWQLIAVDSDLTAGAACPYRQFARAAVGTSGAPVWRYVYTHTFENNDPNLTPYRSFHGAEKHFVFGDPSFADPGNYTPTPAELALSGQIMGYWTRFAATGNPNGAQATVWPPYNATTDPMLQIDDVSVQIPGYRTQQCDFYDANSTALSNVQ